MHLLDTDHMSELERGTEAAEAIRRRLRPIAPDDYGTTIISYEEQMRGRLSQISSAKQAQAEVEAYQRFYRSFAIYTRVSIWQYTLQAAAHFAELRKTVKQVGTNDLKIAAIAITTGATLLTRNRKDFEKVPGLLFENWTE